MNWTDALASELERARRALVALDYDGTVTELVRRPELAPPTPALLALLRRLAARPALELVVASGRPKESLESWLGAEPLHLIAEHGLFVRERRARLWRSLAPDIDTSWMPEVRALLEEYAARTPGAFVEAKSAALAWHYRQSEPAAGAAGAAELGERLQGRSGIRLLFGSKVLEVRAAGFDKGKALARLRELVGPVDFEMAVGDDQTDEDLFAATSGWSIKVGEGPTRAGYRLPGPAELLALLDRLARL